jgi:hypothetical protein
VGPKLGVDRTAHYRQVHAIRLRICWSKCAFKRIAAGVPGRSSSKHSLGFRAIRVAMLEELLAGKPRQHFFCPSSAARPINPRPTPIPGDAEADFYDRFLELTHGTTTIVISHWFSTVRQGHSRCAQELANTTIAASATRSLATNNRCRSPAKALLNEQPSSAQTSPGTRHSPAKRTATVLPGHVSPKIPQPSSESRTEHHRMTRDTGAAARALRGAPWRPAVSRRRDGRPAGRPGWPGPDR